MELHCYQRGKGKQQTGAVVETTAEGRLNETNFWDIMEYRQMPETKLFRGSSVSQQESLSREKALKDVEASGIQLSEVNIAIPKKAYR